MWGGPSLKKYHHNACRSPHMASRSSRRKKYSKEERTPTQWSEWAWNEERRCYGRYRLDKYGEVFRAFFVFGWAIDVSQGEYEYEYGTQETNESTTTSGYQDSRSSETPRYAPPYEQSSQATFSTSPVTPDYTTSTFDDATTAFGNLDLNKGKERETGRFYLSCQDIQHVTSDLGKRICAPSRNFILNRSFSCSRDAYCVGHDRYQLEYGRRR